MICLFCKICIIGIIRIICIICRICVYKYIYIWVCVCIIEYDHNLGRDVQSVKKHRQASSISIQKMLVQANYERLQRKRISSTKANCYFYNY